MMRILTTILLVVAIVYLAGCNKTAPAGAQTAVTGSSANKIAGYDDPNDAIKAANKLKEEGDIFVVKMKDALQKKDNESAKKHYNEAMEKYKNALKIIEEVDNKFRGTSTEYLELFTDIELLQKSALPGW
jgi:predicted small secreted protein